MCVCMCVWVARRSARLAFNSKNPKVAAVERDFNRLTRPTRAQTLAKEQKERLAKQQVYTFIAIITL